MKCVLICILQFLELVETSINKYVMVICHSFVDIMNTAVNWIFFLRFFIILAGHSSGVSNEHRDCSCRPKACKYYAGGAV